MPRYTFAEVAIKPSKTGICPGCGKKASRSKKFFQTLNPFNRRVNGTPNSRAEILGEIEAQAREWRSEPTYHQKCED